MYKNSTVPPLHKDHLFIETMSVGPLSGLYTQVSLYINVQYAIVPIIPKGALFPNRLFFSRKMV